jgi:esterase
MSVNLAFEDVGSGPPLLILHGLFGSGMNWRRIARDLGAKRRVLSVDLRNHGASPWVGTMTYEEMAEDVGALIDHLGLGKVALLGHSMGGKVAMTLALTEPGRVERLIVADVAQVKYGDHFSSYTEAMRSVAAMQATGREEVKRTLLTTIPDDRTVGFLMTNLVRHGEQYDWRINVPAISASLSTLGGWPEANDALRYDGPVTVIDGERSDYINDEDRPHFARLFPRVKFVTIAGAGHWLHADKPEPFIDAVAKALA